MWYRLLALWFRVTAAFRRRRLDRDLQDEIAFHLAMRESQLAETGCDEDEARLAAARRFGNRTRVKEELREMWTFPTVESVLQDIRYAIRTLLKAPAFTVVATLTLALGIGGTVTIFSLGRATSVDSLPYPQADRLVQLWGTVQREQVERRGASYLDFVDWREQSTSLAAVALVDGRSMTIAIDNAERIPVEAVSPPYFSLLGVQPALGRGIQPDDDRTEASARVVVLSDGLWRQQFAGDRAVLGRTVMLDGRPATIIGVMPPGFTGMTDTAQLWVPFTQVTSVSTLQNRGTRGFVALARLKDGVSLSQAQAELDAISARLAQAHPATNEKRAVQASPLDVELFGAFRPALRALSIAVALVLLMACANVASLLLARSESRQREIALRAAIGASRGRVLRQLLTESCVLTGFGAVAGLAIAAGAIRLLAATSPVQIPSFAQPHIDVTAALAAVVLAVSCGVALGLAPAAHARVTRLAEALKESVRGSSEGRRSGRVRTVLVVAEVAFAVVLLVGCGLMIRSITNLVAIDPGFDPQSLLTLRVSIPAPPPGATADATAAVVGHRQLLERVRSVPGVGAASLASDVPLEGVASAVFYAAEGQPEVSVENRPRAYLHRVSPDFFHTMGIAIRSGRTFVDAEIIPDTPAVVVSERLARRFWPNADAIGKRIKLGDAQAPGPWRQIVGVVDEVKYRGLPENPTADPDIYFPMLDTVRQLALVVRTAVTPDGVAAPLRATIQDWNRSVPVYAVSSLEDLVAAQTAQSRFTTWLMGVFAGLALLLAGVGIYGVMSYSVAQRTREIGIRLALGATAREILRLVVGSGLRLLGTGVVIGIAGAVMLRQVLAAQLFQVRAVDSFAVLAVALLAAVGVLACALPALRATRLQAVDALQQA
jgi:putative ABC transport system permease protein